MSLTYTYGDCDGLVAAAEICSSQLDTAIQQKSSNQDAAPYQLSQFADTKNTSLVYTSNLNSSAFTFLLWADSQEEVCLNVQGTLAESTLLPIIPKNKHQKIAKLNSFYQSIKIMSYSQDPVFRSAVNALDNIHHIMKAATPQLRPLQMFYVGDALAIRAVTRLFSSVEDAFTPMVQVADSVDSSHFIRDVFRAGTHVHTEDNMVAIQERVWMNGESHLERIGGATLRPGDIVDVAISFRVVHGRMFLVRLDAITVVNRLGGQIFKECKSKTPIVPMGPKKRKMLY